MSYPMMGTGNNTYSRSRGDWSNIRHLFVMITGDVSLTEENLIRTKKQSVTQTIGSIWEIVFHANGRKSENAFLFPHGGSKWGNKFTVVPYRLDRKSRNRRFVVRKKGAQ